MTPATSQPINLPFDEHDFEQGFQSFASERIQNEGPMMGNAFISTVACYSSLNVRKSFCIILFSASSAHLFKSFLKVYRNNQHAFHSIILQLFNHN